MGMIEKFQQDLRNGMTLEDALLKHNLSFKEAVEFCPKPFAHRKTHNKPRKTRNFYKKVGENIHQRGNYFYVKKNVKNKSYWGGSYNSLEDAQTVRDYLEENGWNPIKIKEACKKFGIERRTK